MENELMQVIVSQGAFAVLFVYMLHYVLKTTKEREDKLNATIEKNQVIIADLAKKFDVLEDVKDSVNKIEEKLG